MPNTLFPILKIDLHELSFTTKPKNLYFLIPMPNAQCPMPNAQCPMPYAQCPMPTSQ
ncbi:hypothetical protein [Nostoc linckia]|uniref:hypothetical protein n=1 Tax=Nostoc linckia TaxID=92942 RepID=UPI0015D4A767|nr:hypothetical protein [Nostoc linckia]